jgi:hypothetical protein
MATVELVPGEVLESLAFVIGRQTIGPGIVLNNGCLVEDCFQYLEH